MPYLACNRGNTVQERWGKHLVLINGKKPSPCGRDGWICASSQSKYVEYLWKLELESIAVSYISYIHIHKVWTGHHSPGSQTLLVHTAGDSHLKIPNKVSSVSCKNFTETINCYRETKKFLGKYSMLFQQFQL